MLKQELLREHFCNLDITKFSHRWVQKGERQELEDMCHKIMTNVNAELRATYSEASKSGLVSKKQSDFWNAFRDAADQIIKDGDISGTSTDEETTTKILQCMYSCYELFRLGLAHRTVTSQTLVGSTNDPSSFAIVSLIFNVEKADSLADAPSNFGVKADHPITHIAHRLHPQLSLREFRSFIADQDLASAPLVEESIKKLYGYRIHDTVAWDGFKRVEALFGDIVYKSKVLIDAFDPHIRYLLGLSPEVRLESPVFVYDPWPIVRFISEDPLLGDLQFDMMRFDSKDHSNHYVTLVVSNTEFDETHSIPAGPRPDIYVQTARLVRDELDGIHKDIRQLQQQLQATQLELSEAKEGNRFAHFKIQENYTEYREVRRREIHTIFLKLEHPRYTGVKTEVSAMGPWPSLPAAEATMIRSLGNQKVHGPQVLEDADATISERNTSQSSTYADFV